MPSPYSEKAMSQAKHPYSAVAQSSQGDFTNHHVRFAREQNHSGTSADIEESELFDIPARPTDTMEVTDNDTLYYGVALGARRRTRKVAYLLYQRSALMLLLPSHTKTS
ncbi:hypothetical protein IWW38_004287 [Coemansia aciculifera]|uniref:Uncharacterized protein n=1 Tax=Coemansia aciculifera TaxID=417176 RepID=A0ACC1LZZ2_9FUNG|nr:hypothetical protein IWW38_004287 [Coemansia aciculifera]